MRTFVTTLAVLMVLTVTLSLAVLTSPVSESFAQGNTTYGNQTSGANNTGLSNDTGSVSAFSRP